MNLLEERELVSEMKDDVSEIFKKHSDICLIENSFEVSNAIEIFGI